MALVGLRRNTFRRCSEFECGEGQLPLQGCRAPFFVSFWPFSEVAPLMFGGRSSFQSGLSTYVFNSNRISAAAKEVEDDAVALRNILDRSDSGEGLRLAPSAVHSAFFELHVDKFNDGQNTVLVVPTAISLVSVD